LPAIEGRWGRCDGSETAGRSDVSIATFNLGRVSASDDAIALVGFDQASDPLPAKIHGPSTREEGASVEV
jgi:hypothetical protein